MLLDPYKTDHSKINIKQTTPPTSILTNKKNKQKSTTKLKAKLKEHKQQKETLGRANVL